MSYIQTRAFNYFRVENERHKVITSEQEFWQVIRFLEKLDCILGDHISDRLFNR